MPTTHGQVRACVSPTHTCAIFIHHSHRLPVVVEDQIQDRPADSRIIRVEVDVKQVSVVDGGVFPASLYVRNLESVADRLHSTDGGAMGRTKESSHTKSQLVTGWHPSARRGWRGEEGRGRERKREFCEFHLPFHGSTLFSLLETFLHSPSVCWGNMLNPTSNIPEILNTRDANVEMISNTSQGQCLANKNELLVSIHYF